MVPNGHRPADQGAGIGNANRAASLVAAGVLQAAFLYLLLEGLGGEVPPNAVMPSMAAYDVPLPQPSPPSPPPSPPSRPSPRPAASKAPEPPAPAAALATPAAKVVPIVPNAEAPLAASVEGTGQDASSGAASAGAGSGAGGSGGGAGGGGYGGNGDGDGGIASRAEKVRGELRARDFPRAGAGERNGRAVIVRYEVGIDGRVRNCRVTQSSGIAEVDRITCELIEKRFRYRPANDRFGNPVPDETGWRQWWWQ